MVKYVPKLPISQTFGQFQLFNSNDPPPHLHNTKVKNRSAKDNSIVHGYNVTNRWSRFHQI